MHDTESEIHHYTTQGGIAITRRRLSVDNAQAYPQLLAALDQRRGVLLASSYEYPGRYKRYDVGFVDPPLSVEARGLDLCVIAHNARGRLLLPECQRSLQTCSELRVYASTEDRVYASVLPSHANVAEEERTRLPSVFSALRVLRELFAAPDDAVLGLYGAFGYDLVFQFEALRMRSARTERQRDLVLYLPDEVLVVDHEQQCARVCRYDFELAGRSTAKLPRATPPAPFVAWPDAVADARDHSPAEFARRVELARDAFARGDLFEVTPSQVFSRSCPAAPSVVFTALRAANPAPYGFLLNLGDNEFLVGASPEMYVRVQGDRVETCPIAGTIARGVDAFSDAQQILTLLSSDKDAAELTMCTDVDRNDKARICEPGSVRVLGRRQIELYSRLIHTVDHVEGRLRAGYDGIDAFLSHMWAVTVTGAPKLDAMQFIEDHELSPRGFYSGAVGVLGFDGSVNTGLSIRTLQIVDGIAHLRAGATLHFDSDPTAENRECELKASALLGALEAAATRGRPVRPATQRVRSPQRRALLIDHRDSFVHTLADYLRQSGCAVTTLRHGFDFTLLDRFAPQLVVLSPGPGRPDDFGMRATLSALAHRGVPVFGVCLGLQGMVEFAGGELGQLATPVHGKSSWVCCEPSALFEGLPPRLCVGRYHSLYARPLALPNVFSPLATAEDDGCIMAVAHRELPWSAVQFHPESILSAQDGHGLTLIDNVVRWAASRSTTRP